MPAPPAAAPAPSSPRRRWRRHNPAGLAASGCGPRRGVQGWVWDVAGAQGRGWGRPPVRAFFPWARRDASPRSAGDARVRREWGHSQRGPGKGQMRVPVVPAADEPGSAGPGLPHRGPGADVWGMGGSWGFGTGDESPRLGLQLGRWGEKLDRSSKPHAGKEEVTKPRPCPAMTRHHRPFGTGDGFSSSWGPGAVWGQGEEVVCQDKPGGQGDGAALAPLQAPQPLEEDPCRDRCPFTDSPAAARYKARPPARLIVLISFPPLPGRPPPSLDNTRATPGGL